MDVDKLEYCINILPEDVIEYIARQDNKIWIILVQVFGFLAKKSLNLEYIDELKMLFIHKRKNYVSNISYIKYKISYHLPNGDLHTGNFPCITNNGSEKWYKNDKLHRDNDKPTFISCYGVQYWHQYGKLHRDNDNPAIVHPDGEKRWYRNGEYIRSS